MGRLKHTVMEKRTEQAGLPVPAPANDESHMIRVDILEEEPPKPRLFRIAPKHERVHWLADQYRQRRRFRMEPDFVSHLEVLELGQDAVCVAQVAADEILQPRITVEPALVLAYLNQPGPDGSCRRVDGDGMSGFSPGMRHRIVPRQVAAKFFVACAPLQVPGSQQKPIN